MEHLDFTIFRDAVAKKFEQLTKNKSILVKSDISGDALYEMYQEAYPVEINGTFRERRHYDGNYDKNFIRRLGNLVAIDSKGNRDTIWNVTLPGYFNVVAKTLHKALIESQLRSYFYTEEYTAGSKPTVDNHNKNITWVHFYSTIPSHLIKNNVDQVVGDLNTSRSLFQRGLDELTLDSMVLIKDLIESNCIYRGQEHLKSLTDFMKLKEKYDNSEDKEAFVWFNTFTLGFGVRFKNTVIGTLVTDVSNGVPLEDAVKMFESKVAPQNYKRTTALITPKMVEQAQEKLTELNLLDSIYRRYAQPTDLNINNVLFTGKEEKALNIFDDLKKESSQTLSKKNLSKAISDVAEIDVEEFVSNILPNVTKVEVLFENKHTSNLMSLITEKYSGTPNLFKWNNPFSWSYNGGIADSALRAKVESLGGRVNGALRFSHTWNYDIKKPNQSLMDLHLFFPGYVDNYEGKEEIHDNYFIGRRVGWNKRRDTLSGGNQDVDFVTAPGTSVPVENIVLPDITKLPEGKYTFKIHNWEARSPNMSGFKAEIEFDGQIFEYECERPLKKKEWVTLAEVTLKDGVFTIEHKHPTTTSGKELWNINTNTFVTVNNICFSPNYWGDSEVGNKHLFFLLDGCKNPLESRGFYNEFLKSELEEHRKVFEMLGEKTKTELSDTQLSGLGFSLTKRNSLIVRVSGKTKQTFKINF